MAESSPARLGRLRFPSVPERVRRLSLGYPANSWVVVGSNLPKGLLNSRTLLAESPHPILRDVHAIFQSNAEFAGHDHGFVAETHAGLQTRLVAANQVGPFMNVQPDAV